ncbi:hypothetical protein [Methylocystis heyeri]|uniref:Uncharacterized protein n=1 Tax=Methylocystis heyeri TaxID=391905 RepID=A0A6B8KDS4_9HYPH|nr:hypothetical protein [Methylocystis heyeri]QGM45849.1 hypothetical protein H2LOC_009120 [Methylocystis heyeri]
MPIPLFAILQAIAKLAWGAANSTLGRALLLAGLAYTWGCHSASSAYEARIAAERAALAAAQARELAREQDATRTIARDATDRAAADALEQRALQAKIDDLRAKDNLDVPPASYLPTARDSGAIHAPRPCLVDDGFARFLREFDSAARSKAASPSRSK